MLKYFAATAITLALALPAAAEVRPFPKSFHAQEIQANGATLHVVTGGQGSAVVLIHGFGDTGDMWSPLAAELAKTHTVVVPDLRGMGLSSHPEGGYDKWNQAADIRGVLGKLGMTMPRLSGTTSAPWSPTLMPRATRTRLTAWS